MSADPVNSFAGDLFEAAARGAGAAAGEDVLGQAIAVKRTLRALERAPDLDDPADRRRAARSLKARLGERLGAIPLVDPAGVGQAVILLETLISASEHAARMEHDFPGVGEQVTELAIALRLGRQDKSRAEHHLAAEHGGDLGAPERAPHLSRAFFRRVLAGDREAQLYRSLLAARSGHVDYFLWLHLWKSLGRERARELFAGNDERAVGEALGALIADGEALARMLGDRDPRHMGRMRLCVGRHRGPAVDHLRAILREAPPARWVDLGAGLGSPSLRDALGLSLPALGLDLLAPDASSFAEVLPLAIGDKGELRLMNDGEMEAYAARLSSNEIQHRRVDLLREAEVRAALPAFEGRTLYTGAGTILDSMRPEDEALRAAALERGLSGARVGAMAMNAALFPQLAPGDVLAFFGRSGIPYLRSVTALILEVSPDRTLVLRGAAHRPGYPGCEERWEIGSQSGEPS
jgi:hypothetical protein